MRDGMSYSESGKLGYEASKKTLEKKYAKIREKYEINPSVCIQCGGVLSYEKRNNKFCDSSCSAKYTNVIRTRKDAKLIKECLYCNALTKNKKYCSNKCQKLHMQKIDFDRYEKGGYIRSNVDAAIRAFLRRYLMERTERKCCICGNSKWIGQEIPLVVDHIDGNPTNHNRDNLRLICGNCDMLLPTFAGRNKGNGRKCRRDFYKKNGYC